MIIALLTVEGCGYTKNSENSLLPEEPSTAVRTLDRYEQYLLIWWSTLRALITAGSVMSLLLSKFFRKKGLWYLPCLIGVLVITCY